MPGRSIVVGSLGVCVGSVSVGVGSVGVVSCADVVGMFAVLVSLQKTFLILVVL